MHHLQQTLSPTENALTTIKMVYSKTFKKERSIHYKGYRSLGNYKFKIEIIILCNKYPPMMLLYLERLCWSILYIYFDQDCRLQV